MNTREERLRNELLTESELITEESLRPLTLPDAGRLAPAGRGPARRTWLAPAAAAIAVAIIAAAAGFIAHQKAGPGPEPLGGGATAPGFVQGIDALSASNVWAVGFVERSTGQSNFAQEALIVHWNGSQWQRVPIPAVHDSVLRSIAGSSPDNLWAVGYWDSLKPLIMHWNGQRWRLQQIAGPPRQAGLTSLAVLSSTDAWAVGQTGGRKPTQSITHWNGSTWQRLHPRSQPFQFLNGVAAVTPDNVLAVGVTSPGHALVTHWNGSSWTELPSSGVPAAQGSDLFSVATSPDGSIWAAGFTTSGPEKRIILHRTGATWHSVPLPRGETSGTLRALTVISPRDIWAVGGTNGKTAILHWDGRSWTQLSGQGAVFRGELLGVSGRSADDLWAVGYRGPDDYFEGVPQILHWNGKTWKQVYGPPSTAGLPNPTPSASLR